METVSFGQKRSGGCLATNVVFIRVKGATGKLSVMLPVWRKRLQMNCNQRWSRETKGNISGMPNVFTQLHPMSAAKKASKLPPRSSGKCASSEPENPRNKDSVSRRQAFSSVTQSMSAELAMTSKMPHRGKPPLASRCNIVHHVPYHTEHRSELVKDAILNGSTHREACKQIQSQGTPRSKDNMNHLFNRTSYGEIIDSELPSSAETLDNFQGDTTTVPHRPTLDVLSSETEEEEEEEADGGLIDSWQDTRRESDSITFSRTACQSSSVSIGLSYSPQRLQSFRSQLSMSAVSSGSPVSSDGCSVTPLLERRRPPHVMPTPPGKVNRGFSACTQGAKQCLASSPSSAFSQRQPHPGNMEAGAFQKRTSNTDTLQSSNDIQGPSTSKTSNVMTAGETEELPHDQDCQGTSAAEVPRSPKDCDGEISCRFKQRILEELLQEEEMEEEGYQCRICYSGDASPNNPLLSPCLCSGSLVFIHWDCLKTWIQAKIHSGLSLSAVQTCELCMGRLAVDPDMFDLNNCYMRHQQLFQGGGIIGRFRIPDLADIVTISAVLLHLSTFYSQLPWMRALTLIPCLFACLIRVRNMRRNLQPTMFNT